ncbi:Virulence sensor histidine kinase PhoQ [bioreactor metagenome]|uniref:histidine kinase n=1 Tax=bioreactor metagenome TaxID=1076179 RepID=A0A645GX77_9ZZZZ
MLEIDVDDDGPGLTEAQRQLIFERGVRLDEQRPGSGLGLDIVRELALTYGGDICATKSPLGGLRMQLRLPASAVPPRSSQSH